LKQTIKQLANG